MSTHYQKTHKPHISARRRHIAEAVRFSPKEVRAAMAEVQGFNAKLAVLITSAATQWPDP